MGFPRLEYWSGVPFPSPGDLPDPGMEPMSPILAGDSLLRSHPENPWRPLQDLKSDSVRRDGHHVLNSPWVSPVGPGPTTFFP